jgi:hypothetical protein
MPRVREYEQQTNTSADIPTRRAQASDFPNGEGLLAAGQALSKYADVVYEAQERQEVSDVHAKLAKARADWTVALQERANQNDPGDATFAPKFNEDFSKYLQSIDGGLQTKSGKQAFQRGAADLSAHFVEQAGLYQAKAMGQKAKQDYLVTLDANRSTLVSDPTQFGSVLAQMSAAINDPNGLYAKMPVAARQELEIQTKKELSLSAVQGLIQNGAPDLAKRQLMDGKWDQYLDADKKHQLIGEADVGIRAKDTAAERQRLLAERERKERADQTMSTFLSRIVDPKNNGGALPDKEILANTDLTAAEKQHFIDYKMRRARELAANHEARTNPGAVRDLMLQIHANEDDPKKTYNMDPVMDAYRAGKISTPEMSFLRKEVEQMRDGNSQGFQKDVQAARSAVYTSLTRSTIGQVQPEVAADAAYRFNRDLDQAIQAKRQKNEDPRSLLDPESKEYMLRPSRLQSYMQSARNVMSDEAGKVKAAQKSNAVPAAGGNKGTLSAARRLPTYQDYDSLKPGQEYTDPQGNTRTKGSR